MENKKLNNFSDHLYELRKKILDKTTKDYFLKIDEKKSYYAIFRIFFLWLVSVVLFPYLYVKIGLTGFIIGFILVGTCTYKFTFIIHEAIHSNLFINEKLNYYFGSFFATLIGTTFEAFKKIHLGHHMHSNTENDPQKNDYLSNERRKKFEIVFFLISPLFFGKLFHYIKREIKDAKDITAQAIKNFNFNGIFFITFSIILNLLIIVVYYKYTNSFLFSISYHLSLATISLFLARIRTIAEHKEFNKYPSDAEFVMSHKKNFIENFFLYDMNFNYHFEHHISPKIHFSKLEQFSKKYQNEIHGKYNSLFPSMTLRILSQLKNYKI